MPINRNSFNDNNSSVSPTSHETAANTSDKGFYVSFEETDAPKRPKPPLRTKKIVSKVMNLLYKVFYFNFNYLIKIAFNI